MVIEHLKLYQNGTDIEYPSWIRFANLIGEYLYRLGYEGGEPTKIVVSLPTHHFFSLFAAMGIANYKFSLNPKSTQIRENFLNLETGKRIIYVDKDKTRAMSVLSLQESPIKNGEMLLMVKDGKVSFGIPERQWLEKVIILDEDHDVIKKTMKVKDRKILGVSTNKFLKNIYQGNLLNRNSFFPADYFYLVGNMSEIDTWINEEFLSVNGLKGKLSDFLYLTSNNTYTNGKLISYLRKKQFDFEINCYSPVIFTDSNSYLRQHHKFPNNPQLIIVSRAESERKNVEILEELKVEFLHTLNKLVTDEIITFLEDAMVSIPNGVDILGWR